MKYKDAKCQLIKGSLFTAGLGIGVATLYTLSHLYQKGKGAYEDFHQTKQIEQYIKTDSRFANGYTLTKFCIDVHNANNGAQK